MRYSSPFNWLVSFSNHQTSRLKTAKLHIFTCLLSAMALMQILTSCESEDPILLDASNQGLVEHTAAKDSAMLKILLHCSNSMVDETCETVYDDGTSHGIGNETVVNKVSIFLFDSDTKHLYQEYNLTNLTKIDTSSDNDASYSTDTIKVKVGTYDIFVIANCNNVPVNVETEADLLNAVDYDSYQQGVTQNIKSSGIVMTNRPYANINTTLTNMEGNKVYDVNIDLERVLAKISLEQANSHYDLKDTLENTYATVTLSKIRIVNAPKRYYFFRHTAKLASFEEPANGNYFTDIDIDDTLAYVIDPFFFQKTYMEESDSAETDAFYSEWYRHQENLLEASANYPNKIFLYVNECTNYIKSQKKCYVTGLLLNCGISPTDGRVYHWDDTKHSMVQNNYRETWPDTLYFYKFRFYESISDLNKVHTDGLDESKQGLYTDHELKEKQVKQIVKQLGMYETNYAYWIRHCPGNDDNKMEEMEYAIVRNNYYMLKLQEITGIGGSSSNQNFYFNDVEPNSYSDMKFSKK